jgi:hypothetical protein
MARSVMYFASPVLLLQLLFAGAARAQQPRPTEITPQAVQFVKQATAFIKVTGAQWSGSGSGFLASTSPAGGLVVTNAHVIGMLERDNKPPPKVEVLFNSGEPNELQLTGKILAVDRAADLAVLRVESKTLPRPLLLDISNLYETQKVYIFGFPLGERLGKNITVSESSVSALRKNADGLLQKVQVNGGMQPGNSGGPVVNAIGQVVGVSVAIIKNTQINFAVPAAKVQALMQGKIDEFKSGEIYRMGDEIHVPLKLTVLDPLKRVREVRVEVWAGKATDKPALAPKQPLTAPAKEAGRQTHKLTYENECATLDVPLPKLTEGQVAWVQPILVIDSKPTAQLRRMDAHQFDVSLVVERVPADLVVKLTEQMRTVHLKTEMAVSQGKRNIMNRSIELDILESLGADSRGAIVKTAYASLNATAQDGDAQKIVPDGVNLLATIPPAYVVDRTNRLRKKFQPTLNGKATAEQQREFAIFFAITAMSYDSANFVLPNKQLQPGETWQATAPIFLMPANLPIKQIEPQMTVTFTYEGIRTRSGNREALISFEGRELPHEAAPKAAPSAQKAEDMDQVVGKFTFDPVRGYITSVNMTFSPDISEADQAVSVELTRIDGNPKNLTLPKFDDSLLKQAQVLSLADLEASMKKLAQIKVENNHFLSVKDGKDGDTKIFGDVPAWLQERTFHYPDKAAGTTQFVTETDGGVVMAVSPRYRAAKSVSPNAGAFTGLKEPWYFECKSKSDLIRDGWVQCGTMPILGSDWHVYYRDCKKGESFRVRTEKDFAPIIVK